MKNLKLNACRTVFCFLSILVLTMPLRAEETVGISRFVFINGEQITGPFLDYLDRVNGELIPPGRYWLNYRSGEWGYEGNATAGVIGQGSVDDRSYDEVRDAFCINNPGICP